MMHFRANFSYASLPVYLPTILSRMGYFSINAQGLSAPPYSIAYLFAKITTFIAQLDTAEELGPHGNISCRKNWLLCPSHSPNGWREILRRLPGSCRRLLNHLQKFGVDSQYIPYPRLLILPIIAQGNKADLETCQTTKAATNVVEQSLS